MDAIEEVFHANSRCCCELLAIEQRVSSRQSEVLQRAAELVARLGKGGELSVPEDRILGSLVHMYANRIVGTSRARERRLLGFLRQGLEGSQRVGTC